MMEWIWRIVEAAIGLAIPSTLAAVLPPAQEVNLSEEVAGVLLATYLLNLLFTFVSPEPKEHDVVDMLTSGYLERLGFHYKPFDPAIAFREPDKLKRAFVPAT